MEQRFIGTLAAILAALFYSLNIPFSKLLLQETAPTVMAGLLYLGAGLGVSLMAVSRRKKEPPEKRLSKADRKFTFGMIVLDIAAPILLMLGVKQGSASSASLLGNFEIVATALIALLLFREAISGKLWIAILFITSASALLSLGNTDALQFSSGSLFVLAAASCWGLENNCTRQIAEKSTYQIVSLKGLCSGAGSLLIGLLRGEKLPDLSSLLLILLLGFIAYGLSIFTYIRAQAILGAARTSAWYAIAPFFGVILSFLLFSEPFSARFGLAVGLMLLGTVFVVWDT